MTGTTPTPFASTRTHLPDAIALVREEPSLDLVGFQPARGLQQPRTAVAHGAFVTEAVEWVPAHGRPHTTSGYARSNVGGGFGVDYVGDGPVSDLEKLRVHPAHRALPWCFELWPRT